MFREEKALRSLLRKQPPSNAACKLTSEVDEHCVRVGALCHELAIIMGWTSGQAYKFSWVGYLHDLGKYLVPQEVLLKTTPLSEDEIQLIREHPVRGTLRYVSYTNSNGAPFDIEVVFSILQHHERWDGGGYPFGLSGNQIEEIAQMVSLADFIEALSANRCYRLGYPFPEVVDMVHEEAGKAWSHKVADLALLNINRIEKVLYASLTKGKRVDAFHN